VSDGQHSTADGPSKLDSYVLSLVANPEPVVCFMATASGDSSDYIGRFHAAFRQLPCVPVDLSLFGRQDEPLSAILGRTDVVYVGGGSTASLLNLWRLHDLDLALAARAAAAPLVVAGPSAGGLCWFEGGITDSFGPLRPLADGLGWIRGSFCPHYDGEPGRRPAFREAVQRGVLRAGWAADDGAAVHFVDGRLLRSVSERRSATTYRLERHGDSVVETAQVADDL
jgi:dipeptidase E